MSFFKKMTKEFEDLKSTFSKTDGKKEETLDAHHGDSSRQAAPPQQPGQPSYDQGSHYNSPPPPAGLPNPDHSLPPGWLKQWDQNSQRWYFLEQASGRTQWEPPSFTSQTYGSHNAYPPPHEGSRNMYPPPQSDGYGTYPPPHGQSQGTYPPPHGQSQGMYPPAHGGQNDAKKAKGMNPMYAAAGGLAAGAAGGALIGHAMGDDSDSDHGGQQHYAPAYGQPDPYSQQQQPGYPSDLGPSGELPDETRSGSSVSSSDKEDVEEAKEEYQEALRDGDGSDIEEAREEYQEEMEETYD